LKLKNGSRTGACGANDILANSPKFSLSTESFVLSTKSLTSPCESLVTRKDWRDMSPAEQSDYFNALTNLNKIPSLLGRLNRVQDYAGFHR
jgi:hypothetical protein